MWTIKRKVRDCSLDQMVGNTKGSDLEESSMARADTFVKTELKGKASEKMEKESNG